MVRSDDWHSHKSTNRQITNWQINKAKKHEFCQQWSLWRNMSQPARSENSDDGLWSPCGDHLDDYHMGDVIRDQSFIFQVVGIDLMQRSGPRNEKTSPKSNVSEWFGTIYCAYLLQQVLIVALSNFAKKRDEITSWPILGDDFFKTDLWNRPSSWNAHKGDGSVKGSNYRFHFQGPLSEIAFLTYCNKSFHTKFNK